jgi:hypothetical protein
MLRFRNLATREEKLVTVEEAADLLRARIREVEPRAPDGSN